MGACDAQAERVAAELAASRARSDLVAHFLAQYQLTPEEVAALQVGDPVTGNPVETRVMPACTHVSPWVILCQTCALDQTSG